MVEEMGGDIDNENNGEEWMSTAIASLWREYAGIWRYRCYLASASGPIESGLRHR